MDKTELIDALGPILARVRTDVSAVKRSGEMAWTRDEITPARLAKHLNGGPYRGVCPIRAGESTTRLGLLDLDSHGNETSWPEMTATAEEVMAALKARGGAPVAFRSSGGAGIHVYLLWDEPQDAYSVRMFLADALTAVGLENGAGGVSKGQVEVFPKQDEVPADGFGNQFVLPLAGESVPLEPLLGLEPLEREDITGLDWPMSEPVALRERPVRESSDTGEVDWARLRSALAAIPNEDSSELDYDEWWKVIAALHSADDGGADSYELAHEFSERSSKYDAAFLDQKVWAYLREERDSRLTVATIYHLAGAHGWTPPAAEPEEFEALPPAKTPPLPSFDRTKEGQIKNTLPNVVKAIERADFCRWRVRRDRFREEIMLAQDGTEDWRTLEDDDYTEIRLTIERRGFKPVSQEMMRQTVSLIARENQFDSAIHWIERLSWDGQPRIERFLADYFNVKQTDYHQAVSLYWWTAHAGRVLEPGIKADMAPILISNQGTRKSSALEEMLPDPDFFFDLDLDAKGDDVARLIRGRLLGEMGELKGMHSREVEHVKAFLSKRHEKWTPKYKEITVTFPRRCVFVGTTNQVEFLSDETGERRFLPVEVGDSDIPAIKRDREQLWAEAREVFKRDGIHWQEAERLGRQVHERHKVVDPWHAPIVEWLDGDADEFEHLDAAPTSRWESVFTTADVLRGALDMDPKHAQNRDDKRVAAILRGLGFEKAPRRVGGRLQKAWKR
ncbi:VapE domain-containing protein [Guyparkeria halopsychrophila]|uniref:VapE domain-containing protein n=1 Tax=Guyparkeria halopsychrophila TaxID=3139421 RepID=UPI0037C7CF01